MMSESRSAKPRTAAIMGKVIGVAIAPQCERRGSRKFRRKRAEAALRTRRDPYDWRLPCLAEHYEDCSMIKRILVAAWIACTWFGVTPALCRADEAKISS